MNLRKLDTDMLRTIRDQEKEYIEHIEKELDRRFDEKRNDLKVEMVSLTQLAEMEGITAGGLKKRCKKYEIPIVDKNGDKPTRGKRAFVNLNLYQAKYKGKSFSNH